jgi:hypothetical protein
MEEMIISIPNLGGYSKNLLILKIAGKFNFLRFLYLMIGI